MKETLLRKFRAAFGGEPTVIARAPGRIEFIGNHTDYNEGYVLSAAINHGTFFALAPRDALYDKVASNLREVKAREGKLVAFVSPGDEDVATFADEVLEVPLVHPALQPIVSVVPLQLLAYHVARRRGCDVDQPRNLAKSVTVE